VAFLNQAIELSSSLPILCRLLHWRLAIRFDSMTTTVAYYDFEKKSPTADIELKALQFTSHIFARVIPLHGQLLL
jgi:hypothetical protein